jgi:4a-hydroxytetrahydrobiopterin dehydratase
MSLLPESEIKAQLAEVRGWERDGNVIRRRYPLPSFADAIAFVSRVALIAEKQDHHPDILIQYSNVTLTLSSHDAGGLTERDFRLAKSIDSR